MSFTVPLLLLILALLGAPLFALIAASAIFGYQGAEISPSVIGIELYRLAEMPVLLAIPLFTFAGYLLGESDAPKRLVRLTNALLGWMPGGLAIVSLTACALFTALTGASGVTIVAMGALIYPALKEAGYPERFNLGLITTSGSLGLLFAPSLPLILYGVVAQQLNVGPSISIDDLFLAGVIPGLTMLFLLSIYAAFKSRNLPRNHSEFEWAKVSAAIRESIWEIPLPIVILGGIYGGIFAISEAAAVTAMYVFIVEVIIKREITWRRLPEVMRESMLLVGGILVILGASLASTNLMLDAELPQQLFEIIRSKIDSKWTFLLLLNFFLLALGMLLDIFAALVIVVPIILPIAVGYNIHPLHLGIVFLANMQIGYFTPPVGMNLFIASYRFNRPVLELYRATMPYFFILFAAVLLITYWPAMSLYLPNRY